MNTNTYEKLGNYRLVHQIGAGGFSEVYLGEHLYLKTPAAIKVLHSRLFDNESLTDFLNEARIIAQLDHPHIVRVLDFGVEEHIPYLALQYAFNGTVRQRYPKGSRVPLPLIVQYVRQIADALQYAHDLRIIHRDIKPENFLLDRDYEVLLGDFGLAIPSQSSIGMPDHDRAGTAVYMAPEQSQGRSSRASDQYALGVVVYEWLCGYPPFIGTEYEILHQHIYATPLPLREVMPSIPVTIEQVVMRAIAKEPSERFSHVQEFAQALEDAYQSLARQANVAGQVVSAEQEASGASRSGKQSASPAANSAGEFTPSWQFVNADPSPTLGSSPSEQEVIDASSQDQSQTQLRGQLQSAEVDRGDADDDQSTGRGSSSTVIAPFPLFFEDHAAIDPAVQPKWPPAAVPPARQQGRISRRTAITAGMLGLAVLGGGAALYLLDSQNLGLPAVFSHDTAGSTAGPHKNATAHTGSTSNPRGTGGTPGTGHNGTGSPSQNQPSKPKTNQGGSTNTQPPAPSGGGGQTGGGTTAAPLTVQIDNAGALAQVNVGSATSVSVTTSQPNIPVTLQVTYDLGVAGQSIGPQTTNSAGQTTFAWQPNSLLGVAQLTATLRAVAGTVSSAPVTVVVKLNLGL